MQFYLSSHCLPPLLVFRLHLIHLKLLHIGMVFLEGGRGEGGGGGGEGGDGGKKKEGVRDI